MSLNLANRINLKGVMPNWDDKCYVDFALVKMSDMYHISRMQQAINDEDLEGIKKVEDKFTELFVGGKAYNNDGELHDMDVEDFLRLVPQIIDKITASFRRVESEDVETLKQDSTTTSSTNTKTESNQ